MAKKVKPTEADLARKAKRSGYRFKTDHLKKKDGELNKLGEKLQYKKPTKSEIEKYKKRDGEYPNSKIEIYYENRKDKKHSDDSPKDRYSKGGGIKADKKYKALHPGKRVSEDGNVYYEYRKNHSDKNRTKRLESGGGVGEAKWLVVLEDKNGFEIDEIVFAKTEDEAYHKAELLHKGSKAVGINMLTDKNGKEIKYSKGGSITDDKRDFYTSVNLDSDSEADEYVDELTELLGRNPITEITKSGNTYIFHASFTDEELEEFDFESDWMPKYSKGGGVKKKKSKIAKPSMEDLARKAKRTGYRFKTDHLKKKNGELNELGKSLRYKKPTADEIAKYKMQDGEYPNKKIQVYNEKRNDRKHSDDNLKKKFEEGGQADGLPEMISITEFTEKLGREPHYPNDFMNGVKYTKCFLKPFYKKAE